MKSQLGIRWLGLQLPSPKTNQLGITKDLILPLLFVDRWNGEKAGKKDGTARNQTQGLWLSMPSALPLSYSSHQQPPHLWAALVVGSLTIELPAVISLRFTVNQQCTQLPSGTINNTLRLATLGQKWEVVAGGSCSPEHFAQKAKGPGFDSRQLHLSFSFSFAISEGHRQ